MQNEAIREQPELVDGRGAGGWLRFISSLKFAACGGSDCEFSGLGPMIQRRAPPPSVPWNLVGEHAEVVRARLADPQAISLHGQPTKMVPASESVAIIHGRRPCYRSLGRRLSRRGLGQKIIAWLRRSSSMISKPMIRDQGFRNQLHRRLRQTGE